MAHIWIIWCTIQIMSVTHRVGPNSDFQKKKKCKKTKSVQTLKSLEVPLVPFPTMYKC